ncbi:DNA repair protein RadC [Patescibacteria group bacterium]|nr:DNA repair protein RadC [Patescibacteria group bacterium]MBU4056469.1 DNA repair protein RadC [Patescibacteria group bacterium]MBU4368545.1 DNA repair protein RadC [Patescibacteria group bacterium]
MEIKVKKTIKELPEFERPREKLTKKGARALKKEELLAIILRTGLKGKNAVEVAKDILEKYGDKKLLDASYEELRNIRGVGPTKAVQILAAIELGSRLFKEKSEKEVYINSIQDVTKETEHIKENKKENFVVLYLDARNKLIYKETVSIGSLNANLVHHREVFEPAVRYLAAQIVLAHNHPSGDPEPSEDDLVITKRLVEVGKIMGIEINDHIIVTKNGFFSFKEKNLI